MAQWIHSLMKPSRLLYSIICSVIFISFTPVFSAIDDLELAAPVPAYPENDAFTTPVTDPPLGIPSFS